MDENKELEKKRVIKLDKPFKFETESYDEIDLSKLEDLTTEDLITAERIYHKSGGTAFNPETTLFYCIVVAHLASDKPIEFFTTLPGKEAAKIKKEVYNFFYK